MITYHDGMFGFGKLLRVHGSPIYKVIFPTFCSTAFLLLMNFIRYDVFDKEEAAVEHPYTIGGFIGFFSFLLTFRLNYAYQRYWEGGTQVFLMASKWVDAAILMAVFHYQGDQFDPYKPPSFGNSPSALAVDLHRERRQNYQPSFQETAATIHDLQEIEDTAEKESRRKALQNWFGWRSRRTRQLKAAAINKDKKIYYDPDTKVKIVGRVFTKTPKHPKIPIPLRFQDRFQTRRPRRRIRTRPRGRDESFPKDTDEQSVYSTDDNEGFLPLSRQMSLVQGEGIRMPAPSLFFQELAHLVSLLCGVAMSTLRDNIEGLDPPIKEYVPGKPWPTVDPDAASVREEVRQLGGNDTLWKAVYYILGISRSKRNQSLYNASRPFLVLGGISDKEVILLSEARGPHAKVALCTMWLKEFISREILHGSVGEVHHALLSRVYQYVSDGCIGYNQARKVAYVPFPFPHGQITAFFSAVIIFIFPFLFDSFVPDLWFACFLNTLTVMCFLGLHEVARELENPFENVPNDLPLTTFQAQINEALVTMYAGYNPDSWWNIVDS